MEVNEIRQAREGLTESHRPSGPVAAAFVATGVGSLVLGLCTALAEASQAVKERLEFWAPVGPLSGKVTLAVAAWALVWAGLHWRLREREVSLRTALALTAVLVGVGILLTFPPIFKLLAPAE